MSKRKKARPDHTPLEGADGENVAAALRLFDRTTRKAKTDPASRSLARRRLLARRRIEDLRERRRLDEELDSFCEDT